MDRLACVNVAAFPLQVLLQAQPAWVRFPVAVVEDDRPQALVLCVNERARRLGVRVGQRYATALALAKDLQAGTIAQLRIDQRVHALVDCLRRYSPHVEPSAETPGVFWLDARGLNRLYPSLQDWAQAVRLALQRAGVTATIAVGFTRFGTYALAKHHRGTTVCTDAVEERAAVQRVPLGDVDLDPDVRERLLALGVETVGQFLRLPGDGIRQRFGEAAHALYQLAAGHRWAPLVPVPADEHQARQIHFEASEIHAERLLFVVKRLLDSLLAALARQAHAVVELVLWMKLDDRTTRTEHVRPAASTLDAAQLLVLVRLRLDTLRLTAGIVTLRVMAETCPATAHQCRLFSHHARRDPDAATQAFARLRAEFHERVVVRARLCDAHLPAAQFAWEPLEQMPERTAPRVETTRPLVRRMYTNPVPLPAGSEDPVYVRRAGPLDPPRLGPYILSGGWWGGGVRRDYYFRPTDGGALQWVYYDHRKQRVFLQGCVE
ncbi:MAG: DNA polymerase Y family protein [Acidobacteria bacterium]|nr:DNA polymerase Y family protein [Acidobacteriota bacterium]